MQYFIKYILIPTKQNDIIGSLGGMYMKISDRIRILMIKRGISKEVELARRMNVSPQSLNSKMKREYFTIDDLQKIAETLDCDFNMDFIIRETGERV